MDHLTHKQERISPEEPAAQSRERLDRVRQKYSLGDERYEEIHGVATSLDSTKMVDWLMQQDTRDDREDMFEVMDAAYSEEDPTPKIMRNAVIEELIGRINTPNWVSIPFSSQ